MYENGRGVARDYVQAHVWYSIANNITGGTRFTERALDSLEKKMTPEQITEAHARYLEWIPRVRE
jgi:hypothetical protein